MSKKIIQTTKKNNKEWLKSIIITWFFAIVFVCAFFGMDVEKNTPMQFVDKMLSWNIVETASSQAKQVKEVITPLQQLFWWISDLSIDSTDVKDVSLLTDKLKKLNELKAVYDELKGSDSIKNLLWDSSDENKEEKLSELISTESTFVDTSIKFYDYLINNQDSFSYSEDKSSLNINDESKWDFEKLLLDWVNAHDNATAARNLFDELTE
jgi:hypothetical protein